MSMSSEQNPQTADTTTQMADAATRIVVDRFNEAFNRHDPEALSSLPTDDTVFEDTSPAPDGRRLEGKAGVVSFWREWFARNPKRGLKQRKSSSAVIGPWCYESML